jgi:hypothetical protein
MEDTGTSKGDTSKASTHICSHSCKEYCDTCDGEYCRIEDGNAMSLLYLNESNFEKSKLDVRLDCEKFQCIECEKKNPHNIIECQHCLCTYYCDTCTTRCNPGCIHYTREYEGYDEKMNQCCKPCNNDPYHARVCELVNLEDQIDDARGSNEW